MTKEGHKLKHPKGTLKTEALAVMAEAYDDASDGGRLPAPARQIAYACRRLSGLGDDLAVDYVMNRNGGKPSLIEQYMDVHPAETAGWDVVRDARGEFHSPHDPDGEYSIDLGTIAVRSALLRMRHHTVDDDRSAPSFRIDYPTRGPGDRFGSVMYIEKEGFHELIRADGLLNRLDLGLISCKGLSVNAARKLLAEFARRYRVNVFVARDFDETGVKIAGTLHVPGLIDLGLRLDDVNPGDLSWMAEAVQYGYDPRPNLRKYIPDHVTSKEIRFLCDRTESEWRTLPSGGRSEKVTGYGRRVELNALVGRRFIDWLEPKLIAHGVTKVIPNAATLTKAYRWMWRWERTNRGIEALWDDAATEADAVEVPEDIHSRLSTALGADPERSWNDALEDIVEKAIDEADAEGEDDAEDDDK